MVLWLKKYVFKEEMYYYCSSDVDILREGKVNQCLNWLEEINKKIGGGLEYKCSIDGEKMLLNRYVDGFSNNVVYQFLGRFFYGCPSCFHSYEFIKINNETLFVY